MNSTKLLVLGFCFIGAGALGACSQDGGTPGSESGWSAGETSNAFDGEIYSAFQRLDFKDKNTILSTKVECFPKEKSIVVTVESHASAKKPDGSADENAFLRKSGSRGTPYPVGRIKSASGDAEPLAAYFNFDNYNNVIKWVVPAEADFRDIGPDLREDAERLDSPAIIHISSGEAFRAKLPINIEVANAGGDHQLVIPASDPAILALTEKCDLSSQAAKRREDLIVWGVEMKQRSVGTVFEGAITNTTDFEKPIPRISIQALDADGKASGNWVYEVDRKTIPAHTSLSFALGPEEVPENTSGLNAVFDHSDPAPVPPPAATTPQAAAATADAKETPERASEPPAAPRESKPPRAQPSFDCRDAVSDVEKAICGSADLASLDVTLARSYQTFVDSLGDDQQIARQAAQNSQRRWLLERNACADNECIRASYVRRIEVVRAQTQTNLGLR